MREKIRSILKGQIATSLIYIIVGLCLICMPVDVVNVLCKFIFGVVLIAAGLYHIWIYVQEKPHATLIDLFSGALILVLGIFLFYNPQVVVKLLPVLLGTFVLTDSIWVLKGSLKLKKEDGAGLEWKILLIGSLVFIGLGIVMIANPFSVVKIMVIFAGCVLLINGIVDFAFLFLIKKGLKAVAEFKEGVKRKEETAASELNEQEPVYAPWSSRNKEKDSVQTEETAEAPAESSQNETADTEEFLQEDPEIEE